MSAVGQALRRKEDPALIAGQGEYVDDIPSPPGTLQMAFVRSPEAHARIASIDVSAARERDGVVAVYTAAELQFAQPLPMVWVPPEVEVRTPEHLPLAREEVHHVGDPVAVVVASSRAAAVDAAELVDVDYEPLPVVVDPEAALADGAPLVHESLGTNRSYDWSLAGGDLDAGFAAAEVVVERRIVNHRTAGGAIEPRAVLARFRGGDMTLHSSTQVPHILRLLLAGMLAISEERLRVIAPDVGGGFGSKLQVYGEEAVACLLARKLGAPVRWTETRSEAMLATHHGRDQIDYVKLGAKRDGTITAIHTKVIADLGAYHLLLTPFIPCLTAFVMSGCYRIAAIRTDVTGVFTNKMATDAIRGAGRPEATHLIEVMIEQLAAELEIDPLELRRRNFIGAADFPAEVPVGLVYDSGDYHGTLGRMGEIVDLDSFRAEQLRLRSADPPVYRGIGFSAYMEMCGLAPSRAVGPSGVGLQAGFWESGSVRVHPSGAVTVITGTSPHGQGHETPFAQIVADRIGADVDQIEVLHGDTGRGPFGMDTYGSRTLAVGGEAIARAAGKVAIKVRGLAAHLLEAAPDDIELHDGRWVVAGTDKGLTLAEVSLAAYVPENLPAGMEPGLEETSFYDPENFVFPFGAHAAIVEVDIETGKVTLVRYVAVDDCGTAINPLTIDGQVHGGIVHGVGQALFEQISYDEAGQLQTATFADYALPTAAELPSFETDRTETPTPVNQLGAKGVGEAGTIACSPAMVNAVIDALRPVGVSFINMPLSPMRVWRAINDAGGGPAHDGAEGAR